MTAAEFRKIALSLPEATEAAHMGEWGLAGATNVRLRAAKKAAVREALTIAWRNRAPKRLTAAGP